MDEIKQSSNILYSMTKKIDGTDKIEILNSDIHCTLIGNKYDSCYTIDEELSFKFKELHVYYNHNLDILHTHSTFWQTTQ